MGTQRQGLHSERGTPGHRGKMLHPDLKAQEAKPTETLFAPLGRFSQETWGKRGPRSDGGGGTGPICRNSAMALASALMGKI